MGDHYTDTWYYKDSIGSFSTSCEIAQVTGGWINIKGSPKIQRRLPVVSKKAVKRLQMVYDSPILDLLPDEVLGPIILMLGIAATTFLEAILACTTDETWLDVIHTEGLGHFACTAWARLYDFEDATVVAGVSAYLQFLRLEPATREDDIRSIRGVFGDGKRFGWSLDFILRCAHDFDLCTSKWSMLMINIFSMIIKSLYEQDAYFVNVRTSLMGNGVVTFFLGAAASRIRSSLHLDDDLSQMEAEKALVKGLCFLQQAFSAYDGQRWARRAVQTGLQYTLCIIENVMHYLSDEVFRMYQDVVLMLIPLSNGELLCKKILPRMRELWEKEGFDKDRSGRERKLLENEIGRLALIRLLRKEHWNPFLYACCNVSRIAFILTIETC